MRKKLIFTGLAIALLAIVYSYISAFANNNEIPKDKLQLINLAIYNVVEQAHYSNHKFNDVFSEKCFNNYLENLDFEKKYFTKEDIKYLSRYKNQIDDAFKTGTITFFSAVDSIYLSRLKLSEEWYKTILNTPFDYYTNETVALKDVLDDNEEISNQTKIEYPNNASELKERWRKLLKFQSLIRYAELKENQDKSKDSLTKKNGLKTDKQLEIEAREKTLKLYERYYKRLNKVNLQDRFSIYINSILEYVDPHTNYFAPKMKDEFDISMAGSFDGIGAQLKSEDDKTIVERIIIGSPCYKQGELKKGDVILKVGQGNAEPDDISGFELDDVVSKIRGKRGTPVKLTVLSIDGKQKIITIIRDQVDFEDTYVKSAILEENGKKYGYISLPEFYFDTRVRNGRRCAVDMAREIENLKKENISGIILDLRNNGGGSLSDVVDIVGLFIDKGPVVKVLTRNGDGESLNDNQSGALYNGPVSVLVNEGSASASEILAAAFQDYKRGVIIGSNTFGKGTVQRFVDLNEVVPPTTIDRYLKNESSEADKNLGSIKITIQKFYRINGGSTQKKGVKPDLELPNLYQYLDRGERMAKSPLEWDSTDPAMYNTMENGNSINSICEKIKPQINSYPYFQEVASISNYLKKQNEKLLTSLNYNDYKKEQEERKNIFKKLDKYTNDSLSNTLFKTVTPSFRMSEIKKDSTTELKNKNWMNAIGKDYTIFFALKYFNELSSK